ncbi:MAG: preprotein translocase subunit SecA [Phycisphaerales bacterium]
MASSEIPVVGSLINKVFGTRNERVVKKYVQRVEAVGALEERYRAMTDAELRGCTASFRERVEGGEPTSKMLDDVFACAREAMDRHVGIRNIFNPEHADAFPVDRLSESGRKLYEETKAAMDAAPVLLPATCMTVPEDVLNSVRAGERMPDDEVLGCLEMVPGWRYVDIPPALYEAVRELFPKSKPPFRSRPFDVQIIGAMVLYTGKIAEMKTGEGKTIVAPLASYLAALDGKKVHVVTVNDYLVQRDRDWTFPFFRGLGLTVGAIHPQHTQPEEIKRSMYACDIVYGTTSEFGFDYLRDNMKQSVDQQVQRVREYAIVDEVDSILIDEARTPLIISGPAHEESPRYELADQIARHLVQLNKPWDVADEKVEDCKKAIKGTEGDIRNARDKSEVPPLEKKLEELRAKLPELEAERDRHVQYYEVKKERKSATLTHEGTSEAQKKADVGSFYVGENTDLPHLVEQALRAHAVYERDVDYIVAPTQDPATGRQEPDVVIVDQSTGRPMVGRQWSDGLHQACQCKEGVKIRAETQTVASVTIQNFFKMYDRLAGMTGTADTEAQEFMDIYKLDVVSIPTNLPIARNDFDDTVYLTQRDKWDAIVDEIKAFHDMGRPVLVGTTSVEKSELVSRMLTQRHNIQHEVLNAKQHEREADIVLGAGQLGAVMIATNMAGRGTDIKLGKIDRAQLVDHWKRRGIAPKELTPDDDERTMREKVYRKVAVKELGLQKREAEAMGFDELELSLLRKWCAEHTWVEEKKAQSMSAEQCRAEIEAQGRFGLHNLRWVDSVEELGGLHVVGTERHESRRIDNQLRGRAGRQGDNGSSRFFVSLDDELMKLFAGPTTLNILSKLGMKEGDAIEHPMLSKAIVRAQRKVEERNFQIRKQILDYDEVLEHQRQDFYGTRQRVLDGRDVRSIIFGYIEDAATSAIERYLDRDYANERIAEYASGVLGVSIPMESLRNKEGREITDTIRKIALREAQVEVDLTIGEYIPEGAMVEDIDTKGLESWARSRFGAELTSEDALSGDVRRVKDILLESAEEQIEGTVLDGVEEYTVAHYGAKQLSEWLKKTVRVDLPAEVIVETEDRQKLINTVLDKVADVYDKREVSYPIEFTMQMTMARMREDPESAAAHLANLAKTRYGLDWSPETVKTRMPQDLQRELLEASEKFVHSDAMERAQEAALADLSEEGLRKHFLETYNVRLPLWLLRLRGERLENAVRARVESQLRAELTWFEQTVMLQVLDPKWKDHLYAMDQLRSTIGYQSFSQKDPRIEFKREGARLYGEFQEQIQDRVADMIFNAQVRPQAQRPMQSRRPQQRPQPAPAPAPSPAQRVQGAAGGGFGGSSISGPGFG